MPLVIRLSAREARTVPNGCIRPLLTAKGIRYPQGGYTDSFPSEPYHMHFEHGTGDLVVEQGQC